MGNIIFHYTNPDSFIKIIEEGKLWATDASKMNDPNEYDLGIEKILEALDKPFQVESGELSMGDSSLFNQMLESACKAFKQLLAHRQRSNSFICSFSKDGGDSLSQWRSYAANGEGFSIGFCEDALIKKINTKNSNDPLKLICDDWFMQDVTYSNMDFKEKIESTISQLSTHQDSSVGSEYIKSLVEVRLSAKLEALAYFLKHEFYSEENEVRVVKLKDLGSHSSKKYRNTPYGISPYVDLDISGTISSVILGPRCKNSIDEIKFFLSNSGLNADNIVVSCSKGEYR